MTSQWWDHSASGNLFAADHRGGHGGGGISFAGTTSQGRPVAFDAVDVFDLAGPRIRRLSTWYDTAAVLRQVQGA